MRTRMFALAAVVAGLGLTAGAADPAKPEFKSYASSDGKYKVLVPGPVKTETAELMTKLGTVKLTTDSVELLGDITFMVSYLDYPETTEKIDPAARLIKVRDGNKGENGKIITDKELTFGTEKYPAREALIEMPSVFVRNRMIIVGNRLYQVMVQGPKNVVLDPEVDRYLDSFEVTR